MGPENRKIPSTPSRLQSLEADLQALGFSEYEARAYLVLLQAGASTAYEVSKMTGMHRANAYNVLESLAGKKVVQPISQDPIRFIAVDPELFLQSIARKTQERCDRLTESLTRLDRTKPDTDDHVWSISGAQDLTDTINQLIASAQHHIWIKTAELHLEPFEHALKEACRRGVQVLVIFFGTNPRRFKFSPNMKIYLHEGNGVPVGNANRLITITRDFEEAVIGYMGDISYAAHTRNRPVVLLADTLIRHEIYFAEIFKHFGASIQKKFGPAIIKLRRHYLPKDQAKLWDRMVSDSKQ